MSRKRRTVTEAFVACVMFGAAAAVSSSCSCERPTDADAECECFCRVAGICGLLPSAFGTGDIGPNCSRRCELSSPEVREQVFSALCEPHPSAPEGTSLSDAGANTPFKCHPTCENPPDAAASHAGAVNRRTGPGVIIVPPTADWSTEGLCNRLASGLNTLLPEAGASATGIGTLHLTLVSSAQGDAGGPSKRTDAGADPCTEIGGPSLPLDENGCTVLNALSLELSMKHSWVGAVPLVSDTCVGFLGSLPVRELQPGRVDIELRVNGVLPRSAAPPALLHADGGDSGPSVSHEPDAAADGGSRAERYCFLTRQSTIVSAAHATSANVRFPTRSDVECILDNPNSTHWCEICDDGVDNDGDSRADCCDADCRCATIPAEDCTNGMDDDCDGAKDCDDSDCASICSSAREAGPSRAGDATPNPVHPAGDASPDARASD